MWNYACLLWALLFASGVKEVIMTAGDTVTQCDFSTNSGVQEKSVTVEDNVTLCGFSELKGDYAIRWKFNNSVIFRVEEALNINDMHPSEIFGNKLELDKQTGSLSIKEVEFKHAGTYHLEISGNDYTKTKQFSVIVNEPPSSGAGSGLCGAGVSLVVWIVAVFLLQEV